MASRESTTTKSSAAARMRRFVAHAIANSMVFVAVALAAYLGGLPMDLAAMVGLLPVLMAVLVPTPSSKQSADGGHAAAAELRRGFAARILALELSVDRLRSVLESLREGVFVVDGGGELVLANPAARTALAEDRGEVIGSILWDVLPTELADAARNAFAALLANEEGADRPVRRSAIASGKRVFDLTAVRVRSRESGHDFGTVFLLVDVTRSHELAHLKDQFLSGISHELRTPLTNICAYAEILRSLLPGESAEWPEFVRIVHDESMQLSRLVDSVFDYAQLESGEVAFTLTAVDAAVAVKTACAAVAERAAAASIELTCEIAEEPILVLADAQRLAFVCAQLLDNALKFTPAGGRVRALVENRHGSFCLRVDDSGPGVDKDQRDEVFEKFSQSRFHLTDKPTGAGIGLATCRAIVERLGGTIHCDRSSFGGASFVVVLPVMEAGGGAGVVGALLSGVEEQAE